MSDLQFVAITTQSRSRRHWALPKRHWEPHHQPLCNTSPWGKTQLDLDESAYQPRIRVVIVDLPPCKQCDKSRQRRIDGRPA